MVGSLGIICFGSVQHALGVASLTSGHMDQAIDHLRTAVQHNLALAHWPAVVASRRRLAQAYQRRGQQGYPPGPGPDHRGRPDPRRPSAADRAHRRPLLLLAGL